MSAHPTPTRRTVLKTTAAAAATTAAAGSVALSEASAASAATTRYFRHGVASGDPRPTAVVLWTRLTPIEAAAPGSGKGPRAVVTWQVATDEDFRRVVRSGSFHTGPSRDHTVKLDATGLQPARWYFYRFHYNGVSSPAGRTRTAPAVDASPDHLRFGVVSCSHWESGYFAAYRHLAKRDDLHAVLHLGDYIYEYGAGDGVCAHVPSHEILSLADYRQRHAQYKSDRDLQALHARYPWIVTWDDHEVANDRWKDGAENHDEGEGDYLARRARAYKAYDEWMPVRLDGTVALNDGTRIYRRLAFGTLAEISMLDLRSYRDQQVSGPTAQLDSSRTITGDPQMVWLKGMLSRTQSQWKVIGTSVMITPWVTADLPDEMVAPIAETTGQPIDGTGFNPDAWDGYTADRREVLDHIEAGNIKDVVFVTGDVHSAWACELPFDSGNPLSESGGVEFVCTSVTSDNIDDITGAPPRTLTVVAEEAIKASNPQVKYLNYDDHGYSVLDLTRERTQMDYFVLADKHDKSTTASWTASYATASGSGRVTAVDKPL